MIVVRFKARCRPDRIGEALAAFTAVIAPSRALPGVISFDIGRDLADPSAVIAVEVFEDREALDRQESLPEVGRVLALLEEVAVAPPEEAVYDVSPSVPRED